MLLNVLPRLFFISLLFIFSINTFAYSSLAEFESQIAANKGKVIYVDFWASWCVPCRKSFPWMNKMQATYADKNFTVLSVNLDADSNMAKKFLDELPAEFPVHYDPKGQVAKEFKLKGMPSSFVINKAGKLVSAHVGFTDEKKAKYEAEIIKLLSE